MQSAALSTMWGVGRFRHLSEFFAAAQTLGFRRFELNHQVDSALLNGVDLAAVRIASVHEPCPADITPSELNDRNWLVSSTDEEGRAQGVRAVLRSIDLAREAGASLVVVHPGRVDVDAEREQAVWDLFEAGRAGSAEYEESRARLLDARAARAGANLDAALRSLRELAEYAGRNGVRLAVENRYHILDIPLWDEMEPFLSLVDDGRIGFLYDAGHAETLERLGMAPHEAWLQRYAGRMVGAHLHDVWGLYDHLAPGQGSVDWAMVARYLPPAALRTCEFRTQLTPEQVASGVEFLARSGCLAGDA